MTSTLTHPLVSAYLRDLELLLHGVDPGERAEVLAGVHEHLDASLVPGASDEDVRRSLAELGSPQSVADEAYAGRTSSAPPSPSLGHPRPGVMSRGWVPVTVGLVLGLALVLIVLITSSLTGYSTTSTSSDSMGMFTTETIQRGSPAFPGIAVFVLILTVMVWLPPLFLCLLSPLWTGREKAVLALTLPVAASALTALPDLGWALTKAEIGINVGAWIGLAISLLGCGYVVLRISRVGARQAAALENGLRS